MRALLAILLMTCFTPTFAQEKSPAAHDDNLYSRALLASLDKMADSWGRLSCCNPTDHVRVDYRHMIVERNDGITEVLPPVLGKNRVEYLDAGQLIDRYGQLHKQFPVLRIFPIVTDDKGLQITINLYWVSAKKKSLFHALEDWSIVNFHYDCEAHKYILDDVTLGGI